MPIQTKPLILSAGVFASSAVACSTDSSTTEIARIPVGYGSMTMLIFENRPIAPPPVATAGVTIFNSGSAPAIISLGRSSPGSWCVTAPPAATPPTGQTCLTTIIKSDFLSCDEWVTASAGFSQTVASQYPSGAGALPFATLAAGASATFNVNVVGSDELVVFGAGNGAVLQVTGRMPNLGN